MRRITSLGRVAFVVAIMSSSLGCELIASVDRDQIVDETNLTDGGGDAKADSSDAKSDVQPDVQADTQTDTKLDTQPDVQPDTQADTKLDTQPDVQPDTKADVQPDVVDSSIDVQPDTIEDSSVDVQPDVVEDVTPDTTADVNPPECVTGSDCLAAIGECELHTCVEGKCGVEAAPDTKVPAQDSQVFCKKNTCSAGKVVVVNDDSITKDDNKECTTDTCSGGAEVHTPVAVNTACGGSGSTLKCNDTGECVGCTAPADCATPAEACLKAACTAGKCGTEPKTDGTGCDDSDLCTTTDVCKAGACVGTAVTCTETNTCRVAGKCDPLTGLCGASTAVVDGSACSDNNLCTSGDQCKNGDCKAVPSVTCTPSKECAVSACVPATGLCAETVAADNAACNDGNACTQTDTCLSGTCTGSNPKTCGAASGTCKINACVPASGNCVESNKADTTACDDLNLCTTADACLAGACVGTAKVCADTDACKVNACDTADGACKLLSNKPNTTTCNDAKTCTTGDVCTNGVCGGTESCPVVACKQPGTCQLDGSCGYVNATDTTSCDDSNLCTVTDVCTSGVCAGTPKTCPVVECKTSAGCNSLSGNCDYTDVSGTSCTGFVHKAAECVDASTLRTYGNTGGCTVGVCTETHSDTVCASGCTAGACNTGPSAKLIISEYIEGASGNSKAIEITNIGNAAYDLTKCSVRLFVNGSSTPATPIALATTLAPGASYVLCNSGSSAGILAACQQTSGNLTFNGDDAVDLYCDGASKDIFGQVGTDPGTNWGTGMTSSADHDLRRKCTIATGDIVGSDAFDPATEWDGFVDTDLAGLGNHCGYSKSIVIDGTNDFSATLEKFAAGTGYSTYLSWDATNLYLGMEGPDVASNDPQKWWQIYLSGAAGTTTGVTYQSTGGAAQQSTLPFNAKYHVRWKADGAYTNLMTWDGTTWQDSGAIPATDYARTGTFIEMRIPLANIGSPSKVSVHMTMLNETKDSEWTWAPFPATSFTPAKDPDYTKYYEFFLKGPIAPTTYTPLP